MDVDYMNLSELSDAEVALRMRKLNYEKFKTLVRMHLSFELDLNTDEFDLPCHEIIYEDKGKLRKWNRLSKKHKHLAGTTTGCASSSKGPASADNSPLEGLHQQINAGFLLHLQELKDFLLLEKNLTQEGIFRKTGSVSRQNELRQNIQHDKPLDLEGSGYSAHDCATVFKGYLAELPEPLLTDAHYPAHSQIAPLCIGAVLNTTTTTTTLPKPPNTERIKREQHLLSSMQLLLLLLPDENRQLLQHIIEILHAVATHEPLNKMSPENLATLFAPHLICPRNLPPEALHYVSKKMSSIVAYMVCRGVEIFDVPAKLSTDIRAYFHERKRKKTMSPEQTLDESISDISTVNTVYTFVDREKTAAAHTANTTDTELAQLYAHIQSLPESSKKRRLIKQFNKQNGQGTPLQLVVMNRLKNSDAPRGTKSIGDSIKKHIFHKGIMSRTPKRSTANATPTQTAFGTPNFSTTKNPKLRVLFQSPASSVNASMGVSTGTPTLSSTSSSQSSACSSYVCTAANTPFSTKTHYHNHPLQKSISSSSLLNTPSSAPCVPHTSVLHIGETESSSSSSSVDLTTGAAATMTATADEFGYSVSAPISRQVSSDGYQQSSSFPYHSSRGTNTSSCSSTSSASQHFQLLDPNCCVTPLKLISEAAKHLLSSGTGTGTASTTHGTNKTVFWDERQLLETAENSNPCTVQQQSGKELKSRYKSEPNLSHVLSKGIVTDVVTATAVENEAHTKTDGSGDTGGSCSLTRKLMKGVSMSNLKFPFSTPESTKRLVRSVSSTLRRRSNEDQLPTRTPADAAAAETEVGVMPLVEVNDIEDNLEDLDDETFEDNPADNLDSDSASGDEDSGGGDDSDSVDGAVHNTVSDDGSSAEVAMAVGAGGSSSNDLPICSGASAYQQLLLQQSSVYRNLDLITSTPSLLLGRRSMSPITKSTQRMPKAMQESIMTPRSRKPVMVLTTTLSSSDQNQTICQTDLSSFREQDEDERHNDPEDDDDDAAHEDDLRGCNIQPEQLLPPNLHDEDAISVDSYINILGRRQQSARASYSFVQQHEVAIATTATTVNIIDLDADAATNGAAAGDALSNNFKQYLLRRSVLTASPVDSSFSSQPDDFGSTQDIEDLDDSQLSPSLLYCLDGNQPDKHEGNSRMPSEHDTHNTNAIVPQVTSALLEVDSNKDAATAINSGGSQHRSRIANNPFILLNNARKRAATCDLEKVRQSPTSAATAVATTSAMQSTQSSNKENFEHVDEYLRSRKLLISEYPGETSF